MLFVPEWFYDMLLQFEEWRVQKKVRSLTKMSKNCSTFYKEKNPYIKTLVNSFSAADVFMHVHH